MEPSEHYSTQTPGWPVARPSVDPSLGAIRSSPDTASWRMPRSFAAGRLVLVALDDGRVRAPLEKFLRLRGYRVRGVDSAAEAVHLIRSERPAAAIIDLGEAPGPALEVAVAMPVPRPVLMLSSTPRTTAQLARVRPRTRLVAKPCSLIMVIDLLQEMLESAEQLGQPEPTAAHASRRHPLAYEPV